MSDFTTGVVAAGVGAAVIGLLFFTCSEGGEDPGVALADSIAQAKEQVREQVYANLMPQIREWRDSARVYRAQRDSAKREMREASREFSDQMEALLATADTGRVRAPQLIALQEVHVETIEACKSALSACEAELSTAQNRLTAFRDSLVPALREDVTAKDQLISELQRANNPGFFARLGQNLEVFGYGALVGAGAVTTVVLLGGS